MAETSPVDAASPAEEVRDVAREPRLREEDRPNRDREDQAGSERGPLARAEPLLAPVVQARRLRQYRSAAPAKPPSPAIFAP